MRFNEFNIVQEDMKLPPEKTNSRPWVEKSALDKYQDPADVGRQQQPAYQRKGVGEPITKPVPGTKPTVNLSNPQQAAAYKAQLDLEKAGVPLSQPAKDTAGAIRPGAPFKPSYSLANDPVGRTIPGEPTMGTTPPSVWKNNRNPNAPASTSPITPTATTAPTSTTSQVAKTVADMRKGMRSGGEYTNIYAPMGPTNFQNKQYIKDLEKEFRKTPNDPVIRAELDKMRGPGIVAAKGTGTSGGRTTNVNDPRLSADIRPGSSDIRGTGRGTGMQNDPRLVNPQNTTTAVKPIASTGTSAPAQSTSGYKGSTGAQAIQQANADKITDVNKIRAGDTIKVNGQDYTIKPGDTLDAIARDNPASTPTNEQESNTIHRIKSLAGLK